MVFSSLKEFFTIGCDPHIKGFSLVIEEVDVFFLEFLFFFYDPKDVGNLIFGSSAFSKSSMYVWEFSAHLLLKPRLKDFEHYLASIWNKCNWTNSLNILWRCPFLGLEWKLTFSNPVATAELYNCAVILSATL